MQSLSSGGRTGRSAENNQFADKTEKGKIENVSTVVVVAVIPPNQIQLASKLNDELNRLSHFEN